MLFLVFIFSACNKKENNITQVEENTSNIEQNNDDNETDSLLNVFDKQKLDDYFGFYEKAAFVISDGENIVTYNDDLANTKIPPYSTFKIPNSIIALETGVIKKDNSLKQLDGTMYSREVLNQNHDLASVIDGSVVWYYKELANDIGVENMKKYLEIMSYGNQDISGGLDQFWLGSSLEITPIEQVEFLIKFYNNKFHFSDDTIETVKSIIKQNDLNIDLYGKSGSSGEGMFWFVGYVMKDNKPYFFATYLEDKEKGLEAKKYTIDIFTKILDSTNYVES